jgi:hypothetical protein
MAVNLSPAGGVAAQFFNNSGNVLTGGKIYTYAAGTTTPETAYTTNAGNIAWSNPIVLDASGRVSGSGEIWLTEGTPYKFILKDSNDVLIATYDNIVGINDFSDLQNIVANFTGTGSQVNFSLLSAPANENSTQIYINGVYQQKNTYSVVGSVITFSQAPPLTSTIEVNYV